MSVPQEHIEDALKMTSEAEVDLFRITLRDGVTNFYFRNGPTVTWQGATYENVPIAISGEEENSDDKAARPKLRTFNPNKILGPYAQQGLFDLGIVVRKRVLQQNLLADANIAVTRVWLIGRITACTDEILEAELRSTTDGPNAQTPVRFYAPPEFPHVSL